MAQEPTEDQLKDKLANGLPDVFMYPFGSAAWWRFDDKGDVQIILRFVGATVDSDELWTVELVLDPSSFAHTAWRMVDVMGRISDVLATMQPDGSILN